MAELKSEKYVASLPGTLIANTIYYVKSGTGFDMYITNDIGIIVAYPVNPTVNAWIPIIVAIPFPATVQYTVNIVNVLVTTSSFIDIRWNESLNLENDSELTDLKFKTIVNNGSFDLTLEDYNNQKLGGNFNLKYKIN